MPLPPLDGIPGRIRPVEPVKDIRQILRRNALAVVLDLYLDEISHILDPDVNDGPLAYPYI